MLTPGLPGAILVEANPRRRRSLRGIQTTRRPGRTVRKLAGDARPGIGDSSRAMHLSARSLPCLALILALAAIPASAALGQHKTTPTQRATSGLANVFQAKSIKMPDGSQRRYALFVPPQYDDDPSHRWPVILFLHGSLLCGQDGVKQTRKGLPIYITTRPNRFPFITIMPQAHVMWFRGQEARAVLLILDDVLRQYRTDPERVYITGLSMGGYGTWELAMARPDLFAAAIPIAGVGNKAFVSNIRNLPIWAFHGKLDRNVPVSGSREPVAELRRLGAKPNYTEYPNLSHECWDRAYATKGLWRWLLKQRRLPPPRVIDHVFPGQLTRIWWLGALAEEGRNHPAHIHAEIAQQQGQKHVELTSEGVAAFSLISESDPLMPGDALTITWNGKSLGHGQFSGQLTYPPRPAPQSQPTSAPKPQPNGEADSRPAP